MELRCTKMKHQKILRRGFIGTNIRPGQTPGGFSRGPVTDGIVENRRVVEPAAAAALERRGITADSDKQRMHQP